MNKRIRTTVIAAAVAGGSILGLGSIGTVSAQVDDIPADDTPVDDTEQAGENDRGDRQDRRAAKLALLSELLGIDADALGESLRSGSTLADIATEQGVAVDEVVTVIVDAKTERIETAVDDGRITQEQADEKLVELEERVTTRVNEGRPERGERGEAGEGFRGPRGPRGGGAPVDAGVEAPADA